MPASSVFVKARNLVIAALPMAAVAITPIAAQAFSFTSIYAFGDSLNDTGNTYTATSGLVPPNTIYPSNGRFSNGPVWVEYLAPKFGAPLANFAFGGARSDTTNVYPGLPGLQQQVATVSIADPNALYVIWAGANDYLNQDIRDPGVPVANLGRAISDLATRGAKNIAVANLPNLGDTPGTIGNPDRIVLLNGLVASHNSLLATTLSVLDQTLAPDVNLFPLDFNALFSDVSINPAKYGFTNVTDSCLLTGCTTPDTYLFWDTIHPTTATHRELAEFAFNSIEAQAVPEPPTTVGIGIAGLLISGTAWRKRRQRQRSPLNLPAPQAIGPKEPT